VLSHIRKVWGSVYTARAISFRLDKGLSPEWAPIGVAVMPLVDARAAGVVMTILPTNGDTSRIVIEGNWGFGESVVSGEITPDSFIVDKESMEILDRRISRKTGMVGKTSSGTAYREIPASLRGKPCLTDDEIREIARTAIRAENHFGEPIDMEWVRAEDMAPGEDIFWVQARPARYIKTEKTKEMDYLIDLMVNIFK
jgi:pyruvate, water dikinase